MPDKVPAPASPSKRTEGFAVIVGAVSPGHAGGSYAKCSQIAKKVADMMRHRGLAKGPTPSRDPTSGVVPRGHQRRWSADVCEGQTSCVIIVRKNKKEPEPPQRSLSLLRPYAASRSPAKRYSCPPIGACRSPSQSSCSSSSSTTSSCSSPPPVPTSVITGRDPLGWKLHPKSSSTSCAQANRLSLQIPLPVVCPDPKSPSPNNAPTVDPSPKTKLPLPLKPAHRCHSDSSAFLRPPAPFAEESEDVFSDGSEGQGSPRRTPPPVPNKTFMARQIAQLIAQSRRRCKPAEDHVGVSVTRPRRAAACSREPATTRGLRLETCSNVEQLGSHFPDRGT